LWDGQQVLEVYKLNMNSDTLLLSWWYKGQLLSNITRQLWEMLLSTANQVRHRAHNRTKIPRQKCVNYSQWGSTRHVAQKKSCPTKLLKKLPHVSSVYKKQLCENQFYCKCHIKTLTWVRHINTLLCSWSCSMSCGGIFICIRCKINDPCLSNITGLHSVHKSD